MTPGNSVTIRLARTDEAATLAHLAELDSALEPLAPALVAEVAGELLAAISLADGKLVANPFRPTADVVELLRGRTPEQLSMIDKNSTREYRYQREGSEPIATALGRIDTVIYSSQHLGSPRVTRFWCEPSMGYLPLRIEQKRADSVEWTMDILSVRRD